MIFKKQIRNPKKTRGTIRFQIAVAVSLSSFTCGLAFADLPQDAITFNFKPPVLPTVQSLTKSETKGAAPACYKSIRELNTIHRLRMNGQTKQGAIARIKARWSEEKTEYWDRFFEAKTVALSYNYSTEEIPPRLIAIAYEKMCDFVQDAHDGTLPPGE